MSPPATLLEFTFDDSGAEYIQASSSVVQVRASWSEFKRLRESKNIFLLIPKNGSFWAIPKRHFVDLEEIDAFRDLVKSHINL